jgi:hypothetical protein
MPTAPIWHQPNRADQHRRSKRCLRSADWRAGLLVAGLMLFTLASSLAHADGPLYAQPADRFGVAVRRGFGMIADFDVASLHIAWYSDWGARLHPQRPGGIEFAQLIWTAEGDVCHPETLAPLQSLDPLGSYVDANPGSLWMIGNEPECIHQGNSTPEQYAELYHRSYTFIKGRDPTAQIAIGGVVQPTPLRLEWLDRVLSHYQSSYGQPMPVDVWNIHNMILPEVRDGWGCEIPRGLSADSGKLYTVDDNDNMAYFVQQIVDFRTWMRDRGERDKPLIISEYGVLMPEEYSFPAERVDAFMNATFDYLLTATDEQIGYPADGNRLVQRWLWYSLNDQPWNPKTGAGFNGALFDHHYPTYPGTLTVFGQNFKQYTEALQGCSIRGQVTLQRPNQSAPHSSWAVPLSVTVGDITHQVSTDALGSFTLGGLTPGSANIVVKSPHTLSNVWTACILAEGMNRLSFGELIEGDANNDNAVNSSDFLLLRASYFRGEGDPGFVDGADFDEDGIVNSSDFILLRNSYFQRGPIEVSGLGP